MLIKIIKRIWVIIYSKYLTRHFNKIGKNHLIYYPLHLVGGGNVKIGNNFKCQRRVRIEALRTERYYKNQPIITIGNNVYINWDCHIGGINKIIIGNNVLIGSKVMIIDHQHGEITNEALKLSPAIRPLYSKGPIVISDNVWIGEGTAIMPNVTIGKNSIIGANSVVTKDIPENCVAAGNPARVIKYLV